MNITFDTGLFVPRMNWVHVSCFGFWSEFQPDGLYELFISVHDRPSYTHYVKYQAGKVGYTQYPPRKWYQLKKRPHSDYKYINTVKFIRDPHRSYYYKYIGPAKIK